MRTSLLTSSLALALWLAPATLHVAAAQPSAPAAAETARVIVQYRAEATSSRKAIQSAGAARAQALGQRLGIALVAGHGITERSEVVFADGMTSATLAARLAADPSVDYAVPDQRRRATALPPNDPRYAGTPYNNPTSPTSGGPLVGQWYLKAPEAAVPAPTTSTANSAPSAINAQGAWDLVPSGSAAVVVAVLDTGIRFDHEDFRTVAAGGNLLRGYDMVSRDGDGTFTTANDGDGRDADASDPGDFVSAGDVGKGGCKSGDVGASSWHGTETAGIIGAVTDNAIGIASVGRQFVRILPVRVLGKCGGYDSDIIAGMRWAAGLEVPGLPANPDKARVINMSLGGVGACSRAYRDAVAEVAAAGAVVVASAGNSAGHAVSTPADCAGVIGVAGLRHIGTKGGFSDLGPEIAISAPGGNCINITARVPCLYPIVTTTNAGQTTPVAHAAGGSVYTDSFRATFGTSFSAPLVAGAAALMLSVQPALTPDEVRYKLQASARPFPTPTTDEAGAAVPACVAPTGADQLQCVCRTGLCGSGMLDAAGAVRAAAGVLPGQVVTLDASPSLVPAGRSIVSYQWTLASGGGIVTALNAPTNGPTVTATPTGPGVFVVTLTTTDNTGVVSAESIPVTVDAPAGGGGALDPVWALLLMMAAVALGKGRRRRR